MKYAFGCIGYGNMGSAILDGAVGAGIFRPEDIAIFNRGEPKRKICRQKGYAVLENAAAVWENCDVVMFAIKPQGMDALLQELSSCQARPLAVSIVAGVGEEKIHRYLPGTRVVFAMPNTPLLLQCGATALARGKGVDQQEFNKVMDIFAALGEACEIPASLLNEVIPVNGSSPAFVYFFIKAFAAWGEKCGMTPEAALTLAAKAFEGAAKMVLQGDDTPDVLIRKVCSPGGATLEGMRVLEEEHVADILEKVSRACVDRAYQLGK